MPVRGRTQRVQARRNEGEQQRVKLASQLPAPMPLTQQEKLLLAFARENPKELASTRGVAGENARACWNNQLYLIEENNNDAWS